MKIVGCDLHARQQSVALLDAETRELVERTLEHEGPQVQEFYAKLGARVVVGIEATGSMQWFLELMEELGIECRVGHPAKIGAGETGSQSTIGAMHGGCCKCWWRIAFPRSGCPRSNNATCVPCCATGISGCGCGAEPRARCRRWRSTTDCVRAKACGLRLGIDALQRLALPAYTRQRRNERLRLYEQLRDRILDLDREVERQAEQRTQARRLLTHPGVGPVTALATEVLLGDPRRFQDGKAVASYIGMIPAEHSSGKRQRLGELSKEGNTLLRYLWCEAAMHAVQQDAELKRFYRRKLVQKGMGKARVAAARKLEIRLWIMLRDQIDYQEFCRRGRRKVQPHAGMPAIDSGPAPKSDRIH
jgi:transposase